MIRLHSLAALTAAAFLTSACATVTRGNSEDVTFTSEPSGATVTTSIGFTCQTPCTIDIKRRQGFVATFTRGTDKRQVRVDSKASGAGVAAGAGNVIAGGIIGVAVDASTGATLEHQPNPVHADFTKPQSVAQANAEAHAKAIRLARAKAQQEAQKAKNPGQDPNS